VGEMGYKEFTTCTVNKIHEMGAEHVSTFVNLLWLHDTGRYQSTANIYGDKFNFCRKHVRDNEHILCTTQ